MTSRTIRCIDLFSGCGGLAVGFEAHKGNVAFETVIALDNHPPAVKAFNQNLSATNGPFETSRVCDLTWFEDPSEVLLYYLTHFAYAKGDVELQQRLTKLNMGGFLAAMREIDESYAVDLKELTSSRQYQNDFGKVDAKTFTLAMASRVTDLLGVNSLKNPSFVPRAVPWAEEVDTLRDLLGPKAKLKVTVDKASASRIQLIWTGELGRLKESTLKEGRGQHTVNATRIRSLVDFLDSRSGKDLFRVWLKWRSARDCLRMSYCLSNASALKELYEAGRRVHLMIGGPPCKGWSRIGRSAIQTLAEQGASVWTCQDFGDERNALLYKYVLFLEALRPDAFIFENVSNFKSVLKTKDGALDAPVLLAEAIESLSKDQLHYEINSEVVRTKNHAIPQDRIRFILFGVNRERQHAKSMAADFFKLKRFDKEVPLGVALTGLDSPKEFTKGEDTASKSRAWFTADRQMPDEIFHFVSWIRQPHPRTGKVPSKVDAHIVRLMRADDHAFISMLAPGHRWMDYKVRESGTLDDLRATLQKLSAYLAKKQAPTLPQKKAIDDLLRRCNDGLLLRLMLEGTEAELNGEPQHLLMDCYLNRGRDSHGDWLERLDATKPSKTIIAHIGKDTYGFIHPFENRAISIREAARIQGFPDWFSFGGIGVVEAYSMIGNAVPPLLSGLFAERLDELDREQGLFGEAPKAKVKSRLPRQLELILS